MPKIPPPHLPPKISSVKLHNFLESLRIILLVAILGLTAGIAGASVVLGWIWPYAGEGETWAMTQTRSSLSIHQLENRVIEETSKRTLDVYSQKTNINGFDRLDKEDFLGTAIAVSSDGWAVLYAPDNYSDYKNWRVLDSEGNLSTVDEALKDTRANILYFHLNNSAYKGNQLKVVSFENTEIRPGQEIYVLENNNWNYSFVKFPVFASTKAQLDAAPVVSYSVNNIFAAGAVAVTAQGKVLGLIDDNGNLLPYTAVTRILPSVLSEQKIIYHSLGVEGYFTTTAPIILDNKSLHGFVVSKSLRANSQLRKGDLITEVNSEEVYQNDFWMQIYGNEKVSVKVLRQSKEVDVEIPVIKIN